MSLQLLYCQKPFRQRLVQLPPVAGCPQVPFIDHGRPASVRGALLFDISTFSIAFTSFHPPVSRRARQPVQEFVHGPCRPRNYGLRPQNWGSLRQDPELCKERYVSPPCPLLITHGGDAKSNECACRSCPLSRKAHHFYHFPVAMSIHQSAHFHYFYNFLIDEKIEQNWWTCRVW